MKKSKKILLGIASLIPMVYMVIFSSYISSLANTNPGNLSPVIGINLWVSLLALIILIAFIRNVYKNDRVPKDKKALWTVGLLLVSMIVMPVYWYLYIWKESSNS